MTTNINADNGVVSGIAGLKTSADNSGVLALQTNGTTAVTVNASQAIGVGSTPSFGTAGQVLTSAGSGAPPTWAAGGGGSVAGSDTQIQYNNSGAFGASSVFTFNKSTTSPQLNVTGTTDSTLQLRATTATGGPYVGLSTNSSGANIFWTWDTAQVPLRFVAAGTEVAKFVTGSGLPTTFQVANSISVGNATPSSSGAGITFPATQSASSNANTLDDYEEGTWTPSLGGTATYNSQQPATYTKVGRLVTVSFEIHVNTLGTGSTTNISGLPFTSSTTGARGSIGFFTSLATNVIAITCAVQDNDNKVVFFSMTTSGSASTNSPAIFGNSARIQGSLTYSV